MSFPRRCSGTSGNSILTPKPFCDSWLRAAEHAEWEKFADVRENYPRADQVGKFTVFDIGGNKYRLIVVIHFNRGKVYIRDVLKHEEYDQGKWKSD